MFAIIASSGKQFRVAEGDRIMVDRIDQPVGETVRLDSVLLVGGDGAPLIGTPFVSGAAVEATVVSHRSGDKVTVFKYKAKSRYRRKYGPRPRHTELKIGAIRSGHEAAAGQGERHEAGAKEAASARPASSRRRAKGAESGKE